MPQACGDIVDLVFFLVDQEKLSFQCYHGMKSLAGQINLSFIDYTPLILWTLVLELPIYILALKPLKMPWTKIFTVLLIANLATHPLICFGLPVLFSDWQHGYFLLIAELFAPLLEAVILYYVGLSAGRALCYSFLANLVSWNLGVHLLHQFSSLLS